LGFRIFDIVIGLLPGEIISSEAGNNLEKSIASYRHCAFYKGYGFVIKGLYYYQSTIKSPEKLALLKTFANRLVQMYKHESNEKWEWFEGYLTYANSILPEAMLYAWLLTGETIYKDIAIRRLIFCCHKHLMKMG
jgi:hypothetical protein